ncbi:hypothetical protein WMY93_006848 [Mugilogobius chulae]|uniref:LINE-1 type transposase domain-containing protein 1 n=1 Tax=Mugilogobius chulae TaxID=88201 RepID=A0AAW0Q0S0_9GOBI
MRGDFGGRLDAIDQRITGMTNTFTAFERKLSEARQEVADNTARIDQAETRIATTETAQEETATALKTAMKRIAQLVTKTEDLENRARRKNLRIFGIREVTEGSRPLLEFVTEMIPTWLGLPPQKTFTLERVHRTLATGKPGQNRAVLVCFLKFQDKEFVYREARKQQITHDGQKITFVQDFSAETVRVRKGFQQIIQKFIAINAFHGFKYNPCQLRILHNSKIHLFSTPREAEKFYGHLSLTAEDPGEE